MPDDHSIRALVLDDERRHAETRELLERILAELAALRAEVRALRRENAQICAVSSGRPPPEGADVVTLIAASCGNRAFSSLELVDHCRLPAAAALRAALTTACGGRLTPQRVGKALQRLEREGHVRRIGEDRDGAIWQCGSAGVTPVVSHTGGRYRRPD